MSKTASRQTTMLMAVCCMRVSLTPSTDCASVVYVTRSDMFNNQHIVVFSSFDKSQPRVANMVFSQLLMVLKQAIRAANQNNLVCPADILQTVAGAQHCMRPGKLPIFSLVPSTESHLDIVHWVFDTVAGGFVYRKRQRRY